MSDLNLAQRCGTGVRAIKKAELWEVSLVTFPLMPEANVTLVEGELRTIVMFEFPQ